MNTDDLKLQPAFHTLQRNWWALALRGLAAIVFGVVAIIWPGVTLTTLVILFGAYALVDGVFNILAGIRAVERHQRWWPLILEGVSGVILGVLTWIWPGVTTLVLLYFIAAWAIVTGILEIAAAVRLRREIQGELLLGLGGLLSVVFGAILIVSPISGALAVVWVIGVYAIIFGAALLTLAVRLRAGGGDGGGGRVGGVWPGGMRGGRGEPA